MNLPERLQCDKDIDARILSIIRVFIRKEGRKKRWTEIRKEGKKANKEARKEASKNARNVAEKEASNQGSIEARK